MIIFIIGIVVLTSLGVLVVGTTLHDIRTIRVEKAYRNHPHARRWRIRPSIAIVADSELSARQQEYIRKNNYRKVAVSMLGQVSDLILNLPQGTLLDKGTLRSSVQQFNGNDQLKQIEIAPLIPQATTIRDLFHNYGTIAVAPFAFSRVGLGIALPYSSWPVIMKAGVHNLSLRTKIYAILRWFVQIFNASIFVYVLYVAVATYQAELFLAYMVAFSLWLAWTIITYPHVSSVHRIGYLCLMPVSFIYFYYRLISAPFRLNQLFGAIIPHRQNAIIKA